MRGRYERHHGAQNAGQEFARPTPTAMTYTLALTTAASVKPHMRITSDEFERDGESFVTIDGFDPVDDALTADSEAKE